MLHLPVNLNEDGFAGIRDLSLVLGKWNQIVAADVWLGSPSPGRWGCWRSAWFFWGGLRVGA